MHYFVIFSLTLSLFYVTDRYQLQQYNIMETETEANIKICMYKDFIMGMRTIFLYFS